jgi:hypothetical protein
LKWAIVDETLSQYAIYDHPRDFPDHFVVREWRVHDGQVYPAEDCWLTNTLEEARALIPSGMYNFGRFPTDDPVILEVWI